MNATETLMAQQIAEVATAYQKVQTGHAPASVSVIFGDDTLVITLHDALTPAEKALGLNPKGAARLQKYHRELFIATSAALRDEITRITGRDVRESIAEVASGSMIHAFTTGNIVQVHVLATTDSPKI